MKIRLTTRYAVSPQFIRTLAFSAAFQIIVIAYWILLHTTSLTLTSIVLVAISSIIIMVRGVILSQKVGIQYRNSSQQYYMLIPGIVSLLVVICGLLYIAGPILFNIPLIGGLAILVSNFLLMSLFTNPIVIFIWILSAGINLSSSVNLFRK